MMEKWPSQNDHIPFSIYRNPFFLIFLGHSDPYYSLCPSRRKWCSSHKILRSSDSQNIAGDSGGAASHLDNKGEMTLRRQSCKRMGTVWSHQLRQGETAMALKSYLCICWHACDVRCKTKHPYYVCQEPRGFRCWRRRLRQRKTGRTQKDLHTLTDVEINIWLSTWHVCI